MALLLPVALALLSVVCGINAGDSYYPPPSYPQSYPSYQPEYQSKYTFNYPETRCFYLFKLKAYNDYKDSYGYGKYEEKYTAEYPEYYCQEEKTATEYKEYQPAPAYNSPTYTPPAYNYPSYSPKY